MTSTVVSALPAPLILTLANRSAPAPLSSKRPSASVTALNGKLVVDHATLENYYDRKTPIPARGPIQLQTHGGEIRWRNIFIREIPEGAAISPR